MNIFKRNKQDNCIKMVSNFISELESIDFNYFLPVPDNPEWQPQITIGRQKEYTLMQLRDLLRALKSTKTKITIKELEQNAETIS